MRKAEKEQICNIIELLEKAHETIGRNIEKRNIQPVLELLADCQEAAVVVGSRIEKSEVTEKNITPHIMKTADEEHALCMENVNCEAVSMLERYCETIYQLFEKLVVLQSVEKEMGNEYLEKQRILVTLSALHELFAQIKIEINNIKIRKTAVFLPYKASMWDSLESVWKAADEDPDCDAYVIPIPYFDRNADGTLGEMHYEGDLYPSYVPVTSYEEFDLEEQRPDLIFIHNPYDEFNRVTSVHSDFYSSKLKNYTDSLVYIPYFILGEVEPDDEKAVENMEHFCKTAAVLNAHKVIVQSEKMKQVYVNVLTEWQGEHTREKWEKKILGIGSPKVDKVLNTKKEDLEIPTEWLRIIEKSDGSWKKIIFYNTSLSTMLQNSDQYLDKVEDVLRIFKENKDEVALLWRPHPLFMQTIESMRPELKERYIEVVQRYRAEGWGIYDESAELDRAVLVNDGYYGDRSSVVELFLQVNKFIMIQKIEKDLVHFSDCAVVDSKLYFCFAQENLLIEYDLKSTKSKILFDLKTSPVEISSIDTMISDQKNLYMLDITGKFFVQYSLTEQVERIIEIACDDFEYYNFAGMTEHGGYVYVFPRYCRKIICIDKTSGAVVEDDSLYQEIENTLHIRPYFSWALRNDNDMWLIGEFGESIVKYSLITGKFTIYHLLEINQKCIHAFMDHNEIYILSEDGKVFCWQLGAVKVKLILETNAHENEYSRVFVLHKKIYLLPLLGENILTYDIEKKEIFVYKEYPKNFQFQTPKEWSKYVNYCEDEQYIYVAVASTNYMLCLNKRTGTLEWRKFECMLENQILPDKEEEIMLENVSGLRRYINSIQYREFFEKLKNVSYKSGFSIWSKVSKERDNEQLL